MLLLCWRSYSWAHNLWVLIIYLFFLPVILPSVVPRLTTDSAVSVCWSSETSLFLRLPSQDGAPSLPLLSLFFVFYIFSYLLSKTMGCFSGCLMSSAAFRHCFVEFTQRLNVLLMNVWGRKWSPRPIPPPSSDHPPPPADLSIKFFRPERKGRTYLK